MEVPGHFYLFLMNRAGIVSSREHAMIIVYLFIPSFESLENDLPSRSDRSTVFFQVGVNVIIQSSQLVLSSMCA